MEEYKTVEKEASDSFVEKKSRFIGYVKPVRSQEEAVNFINEIKAKHWDATHNVFAYVLREDNIRRYSDDGEPGGTAGLPVLEVILKAAVTDVCVVATRYFGGTLLGAGGLVRAYSHTSKIALDAGGVITMAQCSVCCTEVDYSFYERLNSLAAEFGANVLETAFSDLVKMTVSVKESRFNAFNERLIDLSNGKYSLQYLYTQYDKAVSEN